MNQVEGFNIFEPAKFWRVLIERSPYGFKTELKFDAEKRIKKCCGDR